MSRPVPTIRAVARFVGLALSIAVLVPCLLLIVAVGTAAIVGGGFGDKVVGLSGPLHSSAPLVMAHRGLRHEHPEHSRAAFRAALEAGFEAVEIDVKRSVDGHYYLFHDRRSSHLLNVDIDLASQTLADLERYPLHRDGQATDQRILSLEAFADEFGDEFVVYLDIKRHGDDDYERLARDIARFIEEHDIAQRSIVGGDFLFVSWFEYRFPELHTALGGPGDGKAKMYRWIPTRFRPDFMLVRLGEITPVLVRWLREEKLFDRWIVYDAEASDLEPLRKLGFSKVLLD